MSRLKKIKNAKIKLNRILTNKSQTFLIHYSCESFVDNEKGSHKVSSIAVRSFDSAQTYSFSIFQCAEELKLSNLTDNNNFRIAEKKLLDDFFDFVDKHKKYIWVHWSMRDINYGFVALEHRHKALGGSPCIIDDNYKIDLSRLLHQRFSKHYIGHPRLYKLIDLNNITKLNILDGKAESVAFQNGNFLKLHQSTLRKVHVFDSILNNLDEGSLKVQSSILQQYGLNISAISYWVKKHPFFPIITIIGTILSIIMFVSRP